MLEPLVNVSLKRLKIELIAQEIFRYVDGLSLEAFIVREKVIRNDNGPMVGNVLAHVPAQKIWLAGGAGGSLTTPTIPALLCILFGEDIRANTEKAYLECCAKFPNRDERSFFINDLNGLNQQDFCAAIAEDCFYSNSVAEEASYLISLGNEELTAAVARFIQHLDEYPELLSSSGPVAVKILSKASAKLEKILAQCDAESVMAILCNAPFYRDAVCEMFLSQKIGYE